MDVGRGGASEGEISPTARESSATRPFHSAVPPLSERAYIAHPSCKHKQDVKGKAETVLFERGLTKCPLGSRGGTAELKEHKVRFERAVGEIPLSDAPLRLMI